MSLRRFLAKPALARAANRPDNMPVARDSTAMPIRMPPYVRIVLICTASVEVVPSGLMAAINSMITSGMRHSRITSMATNTGESIDGVLYSRILFANVLIILRYSLSIDSRNTGRRVIRTFPDWL